MNVHNGLKYQVTYSISNRTRRYDCGKDFLGKKKVLTMLKRGEERGRIRVTRLH